jgi:CRISPR system Cascade subunit CasB
MSQSESQTEAKSSQKEGKEKAFVEWVISEIAERPDDSGKKPDTAMRARLRRADNPKTEQEAWRYLAPFVPDFSTNPRALKAYATVAAALARSAPKHDGSFGFGQSLAAIYADEAGSEKGNPAETRLLRLLACRTTEEACEVLRPLLPLVAEKSTRPLSYARLLSDLIYFGDSIRRRWAEQFYTLPPSSEKPQASQGGSA